MCRYTEFARQRERETVREECFGGHLVIGRNVIHPPVSFATHSFDPWDVLFLPMSWLAPNSTVVSHAQVRHVHVRTSTFPLSWILLTRGSGLSWLPVPVEACT